MTDETVSRTEYESRNAELRTEMRNLEAGLKTDIGNINTKLDTLNTQVAKNNVNGWKLVGTSSLSLIIGYLAYYIQHLVR